MRICATSISIIGICIALASNVLAREHRVIEVTVHPAAAQARSHFMPTPWNVEVRKYRYDRSKSKYIMPTERVASGKPNLSGKVQFTVDVLPTETGTDTFYRVVCLGGSHYHDGISDEIPVQDTFTETTDLYMKKKSGAAPKSEYQRDEEPQNLDELFDVSSMNMSKAESTLGGTGSRRAPSALIGTWTCDKSDLAFTYRADGRFANIYRRRSDGSIKGKEFGLYRVNEVTENADGSLVIITDKANQRGSLRRNQRYIIKGGELRYAGKRWHKQ